MKPGDTVLHRPSGETWTVSARSNDYIIPGGWPMTVAKKADCDMVEECSPEEHRSMLSMAVRSGGLRGEWAAAEQRLLDVENQPEGVRG
jgi:hypothetical protein